MRHPDLGRLRLMAWSLVLVVSCHLDRDASAHEFIPQASANASVTQAQPVALMVSETFGNLQLDMPAEALISQLGNPNSQGEMHQWGADGLYHQDWHYPRLGIQANLSAPIETGSLSVFSLTMRSPSEFKTQRNIGIGDTWEQVEAAYGDEQDTESSQERQLFVAGSIYGGIIFSFENGQVSQIFLGAAAE